MKPMVILLQGVFLPSSPTITCSKLSFHSNSFVPPSTIALSVPSYVGTTRFLSTARVSCKKLNCKDLDIDMIKEGKDHEDDDEGGFFPQGTYKIREENDVYQEEEQEDKDDADDRFSRRGLYDARDEKDYDRDPEFAEIIGSCLEDPQKAQSKVSNMV
ncbi:hypothetical protein L6164_016986 [Bauhinia variegata]|uniref:Uncharacterized protein n=1 Tax=Bauhinia variegata TaxID=167791 RepID=A0ACB9N705_BAUVA|nr:hypothetical protein L6164_016986 [Bauhinia variegata]